MPNWVNHFCVSEKQVAAMKMKERFRWKFSLLSLRGTEGKMTGQKTPCIHTVRNYDYK